jgi:hypothetical protein
MHVATVVSRPEVDRAIVAVVFILGTLISGCSTRVPESELAGVYVAEFKNGTEKLTLEKGGKFVQEVTVRGSDKPVVHSGRWKYQLLGNEISARVALEDCLGVGDGFGAIRPDFTTNRGGCSFPVERRWFIVGRLRLGPDEASPRWKQ